MSQQVPPYMMGVKNINAIFTRIKEAGTPPKFTHEFLKSSLGFPSSSDRNVVSVLKSLGFLTSDGTPTDQYNAFRGADSKRVMAAGLREGWSEIFMADQQVYSKPYEQMKEIFKSVTGKGEAVAEKMASTFKSLCTLADFSETPNQLPLAAPPVDPEPEQEDDTSSKPKPKTPIISGLNLHHDIHLHLPSTSDVAVYKAIFRAVKDELSD